MKNFLILFLIFFFKFNLANADLMDSLSKAFANNPKINAERANLRAMDQNKKDALSEFRPSVTISGYLSEQNNEKGTESNFKPSERSLLVEQKIFQGGGAVANLKKEELSIEIAKYYFKKIEQEILLKAVDAHFNYILTKKTVNINK